MVPERVFNNPDYQVEHLGDFPLTHSFGWCEDSQQYFLLRRMTQPRHITRGLRANSPFEPCDVQAVAS